MELPPDDDGGLALPEAPPSDDGDVLLPESDSDGQDIAQLASASGQGPFKTPMKRMRSSPTQNQGLQPGPVARDPPPAVIDGQPGGLDLPEDVVNDDSELDDIFGDVATVSPDKRHRQCARGLQRKTKKQRQVKEYPGPSSSEVMASLIQRKAPVVVPPLGLMLDGTLADDVMEMFSPPRILERTQKLGLRGNLSADLATGWDLSLQDHQTNLLAEIHRRRPKIVFLEPPCTWFSRLLSLNWKHVPRHIREQAMACAILLLEFSFLIMRIQLLAGRAFVLEHPLTATSWKHPQVQDALDKFPGTSFADFDFCMFGMVTKVHRVPVKKATRLMTNCPHVLKCFQGVQCDGAHDKHTEARDSEGGEKRSKYAQYYPDLFCSRVAQCSADFCRNVPC